mmetsp:Transcript_5564/g.8136  ORF Transcript_5564/g.8136 Transcript_5564/m.8136 type:complete len:134 (+) Transcript_5564:114-515(+)
MNALSFPRKLLTVTNIAPLGSVEQSSTYNDWRWEDGAAASNAVDGLKGGDSTAHTNWEYEYEPWWKVTFDSPVSVGTVVFFNRKDCCCGRARDLTVQVLMSGNPVKTFQFLMENPPLRIVVNYLSLMVQQGMR